MNEDICEAVRRYYLTADFTFLGDHPEDVTHFAHWNSQMIPEYGV